MRFSRNCEPRRKPFVEDSWRRIFHSFRRHSAIPNEALSYRPISTVQYESYPRTLRTSLDITAYYSAKPLPPVPSPGPSTPRNSIKVPYAQPSVSTASSSPSSPARTATIFSSTVIQPQQQGRSISTPISRFPVRLAGDLHEPERYNTSKRKRKSLTKKFSLKCLRRKPEIREISSLPPLPRHMSYEECLM